MSLTSVINCFKYLYFWCGVFRVGFSIKSPYEITTTHNLWSPITDQSGINLSAWQSIYFVAHIQSIWFLPLKRVSGHFFLLFTWLSLTFPTVWGILINLTLLISSLASIINMIIFYFLFHFLINTLAILWITSWGVLFPLLIYNTLFVDNIQFQFLWVML